MNNALSLYNPAAWLDQFFDDFDRGAAAGGSFHPAVDIREEKDAYVLRAELPGVPKENLKLEVKDNRLTLSGSKEGAWKGEKDGYRYQESRYGEFSRAFELPRNVQVDAISAEFQHGVLSLRIPKAKEAMPKAIEIK